MWTKGIAAAYSVNKIDTLNWYKCTLESQFDRYSMDIAIYTRSMLDQQ